MAKLMTGDEVAEAFSAVRAAILDRGNRPNVLDNLRKLGVHCDAFAEERGRLLDLLREQRDWIKHILTNAGVHSLLPQEAATPFNECMRGVQDALRGEDAPDA